MKKLLFLSILFFPIAIFCLFPKNILAQITYTCIGSPNGCTAFPIGVGCVLPTLTVCQQVIPPAPCPTGAYNCSVAPTPTGTLTGWGTYNCQVAAGSNTCYANGALCTNGGVLPVPNQCDILGCFANQQSYSCVNPSQNNTYYCQSNGNSCTVNNCSPGYKPLGSCGTYPNCNAFPSQQSRGLCVPNSQPAGNPCIYNSSTNSCSPASCPNCSKPVGCPSFVDLYNPSSYCTSFSSICQNTCGPTPSIAIAPGPPIFCDLCNNNQPTSDIVSTCYSLTPTPNPLYTAIGCIPYNGSDSISIFFLKWALGIAGGVAFILIVTAGFMMLLSSGDPGRVKAAKELLTAATTGLALIIFSVFLLHLIGVDILGIPF